MRYKAHLPVIAVLCLAEACSPKAQVKGTLTGAPEARLVVKKLAAPANELPDTVRTDAAGNYTYRLAVPEGEPEFVYLYKGDTKVASLILQKGDRVKVVSDTLGGYTVEGSEESAKLQRNEQEFAEFMQRFTRAAEAGDNAAASRQYIDYYRSRVRYVLDNMKSLTAIPVLYEKINADFPVFSQATDAIHFRNVFDSLSTVYPRSRYVQALGKEAQRRENLLSLRMRVDEAARKAYPDLELPSIDGAKVSLSGLDAKVVMIYFWSAADAAQKMFNQDVLLPLYKTYHDKGFEIYAVCMDTDKGAWAGVVKNQQLPWINVCDGLGAASQAAVLYNVGKLPMSFMLVDGTLSDTGIIGEASLRKFLETKL